MSPGGIITLPPASTASFAEASVSTTQTVPIQCGGAPGIMSSEAIPPMPVSPFLIIVYVKPSMGMSSNFHPKTSP